MQASLGTFVDLVIRIYSAEELFINNGALQGNPYLLVDGVDMDGEHVGPLRLWDYVEGDLEPGNTCILRGLKIAVGKVYDDSLGKWVSNAQGGKTLVCDTRTAIEDVSGIVDITSYFN